MDEKSYILKTKSTTCILAYIAIVLVITPILYMAFNKTVDNTNLLQAILNVLCYLSLAIIFIIILRNYLYNDLKEIRGKKILIFLSIIVGTIITVKLTDLLFTWIYSSLNQDMGNNQEAVESLIKENAFLMFLSSVIFAPFVEEIVYRKCIFSYFNNDWIAILVSTIAFGLIHVLSSFDFIHIFPYLAAGFIFSLAYKLSKRNIWVTIIAHSLINLISFITLVL